eukprot:403376860
MDHQQNQQIEHQRQISSQEDHKVVKFYRTLLQQHQDSQKLSMITLQITKILNLLISQQNQSENHKLRELSQNNDHLQHLNPQLHSGILGELFNLVNLLIYPQRIYLTQNLNDSSIKQNHMLSDYDSSQAKVRDVILYLKVIKQVLKMPQSQLDNDQDAISYYCQREDEDYFFALSDIIDDSNLNIAALIRHLMYVWERLVGKQIDKIDTLSLQDIQLLQKNLKPLFMKSLNQQIDSTIPSALKPSNIQSQSQPNLNSQSQINAQSLQNSQVQSHQSLVLLHQNSFKELEQSYYKKLKYLEQKLAAYKQEYVKVKSISKQQEKLIVKYEGALKQLSQKKESIQKQQDLKNSIFESFLSSLKSEYQQELQKIKGYGVNSQIGLNSTNIGDISSLGVGRFEDRSRSISPINFNDRSTPSININFSQYEEKSDNKKSKQVNQQVQTEINERYEELLKIEINFEQMQRDFKSLQIEKRELLSEKHLFNERLSELQESYSLVQEKLDRKIQKIQQLKQTMHHNEDQGLNNQAGIERVKEELDIALRQKNEAELRTKKFEAQFRAGLKEINELRELVDQLQQAAKDSEHDFDKNFNMPVGGNGGTDSQSSSFMLFNQSTAQQDLRINEMEREKEILYQKISLLEKSNKELIAYKKSLEETIDEISKEKDIDKRLQMVNFNLIRRKSLLRLESSAIFKDTENTLGNQDTLAHKVVSSYIGQRQSVFQQYTPGNKHSQMSAPNTAFEASQQNLLLQIPSLNYQSQSLQRPENVLTEILDQIQSLDSLNTTRMQRLDSVTSTPVNFKTPTNMNIQDGLQLDLTSNKSMANDNNISQGALSQNDIVVQTLFQPTQDSYYRQQTSSSNNLIDERAQELQQLKDNYVKNKTQLTSLNSHKSQSSLLQSNFEEQYEDQEQDSSNIMMMQLKKQKTQGKQQKEESNKLAGSNSLQSIKQSSRNNKIGQGTAQQKSIIKEVEDEYDEDEYGDEDDSSDYNSELQTSKISQQL